MFPAMVIVPTLQIAWTLFSIVSGMLYFREYRDFTGLSAAMFAVGLAVRTWAGRGAAGDRWAQRRRRRRWRRRRRQRRSQ
jgi:hypothetical protein